MTQAVLPVLPVFLMSEVRVREDVVVVIWSKVRDGADNRLDDCYLWAG